MLKGQGQRSLRREVLDCNGDLVRGGTLLDVGQRSVHGRAQVDQQDEPDQNCQKNHCSKMKRTTKTAVKKAPQQNAISKDQGDD